MIEITPPTADTDKIAPILRVLRSAVPEALFRERLRIATEHGYRAFLARATTSDETVGCLGFHRTHDVFWGKTLYIDDLVVHPKQRGQKIGEALMEAAKDLAARQTCDHMRLCSGFQREDAHRFYENNDMQRASLHFAHAIQSGDP